MGWLYSSDLVSSVKVQLNVGTRTEFTVAVLLIPLISPRVQILDFFVKEIKVINNTTDSDSVQVPVSKRCLTAQNTLLD